MNKTTITKKEIKIRPAEMTLAEILVKIEEMREKQIKQKLERAVGKVKDTRAIFHSRKQIARLLTALKDKKEKKE